MARYGVGAMQRLRMGRGLGVMQRRILESLQEAWSNPDREPPYAADLYGRMGLTTYPELQSARRALRGLRDRSLVGESRMGALVPPEMGLFKRPRCNYRMAADRDQVADLLTDEWQAASSVRDSLGLVTYEAKRAIRQLCNQQRAELWQDPEATAPTIRDWLVRRPRTPANVRGSVTTDGRERP